jgi:hypothetical protein
MKKLFTLTMLLLCAVVGAKAATESSGNQGSNNTSINGTSYSLDGKYIAGKGGVQQGNMPDKGVKLRSNQGNLIFAVNAGYKITKFEFWSAGNTTTAVDITAATVDGGSNLLSSKLTIPVKGASTSCDITLSDINATNNITLTFAEGSTAQIVGTWKITYVQEQVVSQEITSITLNGAAISDTDLATLKSTKAVTIDGSSLNGAGNLDVTLSSGGTTVSKTVDGTSVKYSFTINSSDKYTITVTNVAKTYTKQGVVVAYSENETNADGVNTMAVTMNGITFTMVDENKTFQYGTGSVTLGSDKYVPLKLSTGSAVYVTFPAGMKASKVIVYGWSLNGNGKLAAMKETANGEKSVDVSNDVYYATNTAGDVYPSVYEYDLDDWESLYFNPGGSPSQPFVVMEFVFSNPILTATESVNLSIGPTSIGVPASATINLTGSNLTNGVYNAPTGSKVDISIFPETFTVTDGTINQDFIVSFNAMADCEGSEELTFTIGEATAKTIVNYSFHSNFNEVSETSDATTWNFTGWDETYEFKNDGSTVLDNNNQYTYADIAEACNLSLPSGFDGKTLAFKGQFPIRSKKSQAGTWTLKTTVKGNLEITFSDTGSKGDNPAKRYLNINGRNTKHYTQRTGSSSDQKTVTVYVPAGEINITGMGENGTTSQAICMYSIKFTPVETLPTTKVTIGDAGYRTFTSSSPLNFTTPVEGLTAYKATVATVEDKKVVTFTKVETTVPAGEGLLLKGVAGEYTINVASEMPDAIENALIGTLIEKKEAAGIFVLMNGKDGVGFYKTTNDEGFTVGANTAYLPASVAEGRAFIGFADEPEATGINEVKTMKASNDIYNLKGQRVEKAKKGLYIIGGKKVVMK